MDLSAATAFPASLTPGPDLGLLPVPSSLHGPRPAPPMTLGITLGFPAMILALGLGLALAAQAGGQFRGLLTTAAFFWIVWPAVRIATSAVPGEQAARPPIGFLGAVGFPWVHPKARLVAVAALGAFVPAGMALAVGGAVLALLFAALSLPGLLVWAGFGVALRRVLSSSHAWRAYSVAMALLLAASLLPLPWRPA